MVFQSLVNNAAILLTLSFLYTLVARYWKANDLAGQVMRGLLFGFVVIGVMLTPLQLSPGLVFDTRSVVISISGLFCGPITAAITALFSIAYRIWLGGVGVAPGITSAISAATIGVLFFYWRPRWQRPRNALYFYLFGLLVHAVIIVGMFTLPRELAWQTINKVTLPVMLIYPLASLLLALLLADQERRIATESQLAESEERFRTLFEQAGDAIFVSDFDGHLQDVNEAAQKSLGYSRDELLELKVQDVDPNFPDRHTLQDFWRQHLRSTSVTTFESVHRRKDGSTFPVEVGAGYMDYGGKRLVLGLARDISDRLEAEEERKRLERQLLHAQKMEAIGTLAGGIAHEFNNILTTIVGYAELSLVRYNSDGSFAPAYLEEILNSSKRAADLVKRILAFSRKAEAVEFEVFDINKEIDHALTILGKTIPREIRVEKNLSPAGSLVRGDAGQLEQVLLNLGTNAKHAMPDGGRLSISSAPVTIGAERPPMFPDMKPGAYVELTVSDTGHGMEPEVLAQIFDPFFTTKEVGAGTGLGLSMVYGIIKGHHGYIGCTSQPGQGTIFQIFLPLVQDDIQSAAQSPRASRQLPAGHNETILLVDDEPSLLDIGKIMLEENGYQVLQASSGEGAVALFEAQGDRIDVVLLDVSMPGMGGLRCLKKLLEIEPTVRVILASGYAVDDSLQEIVAQGAVGFISKPYTRKDLMSAIDVALAR